MVGGCKVVCVTETEPGADSPSFSLASLARETYTVCMRLNILEAKNRLSELVRAARAGKEVVIAKNGKPMVRLVPVETSVGLKGFGSLKSVRGGVDKAFSPAAEREIARLFHSRA